MSENIQSDSNHGLGPALNTGRSRPQPLCSMEIVMQLVDPNSENIQVLLDQHDAEGGNAINESLSKLFDSLNNEENAHEVYIKVAALNQIYSTAIQYIAPVVNKIIQEIDSDHRSYNLERYVELVDKISVVNWVSPTTSKEHTRRNISFSSKYIHFLSGRKLPIYDSYIWIVMIGYISQRGEKNISFSTPETYSEFFQVFCKFKIMFYLNKYSNYEIDKFLWQYGKNLLNEIIKNDRVNLDQAKSILKKSVKKA